MLKFGLHESEFSEGNDSFKVVFKSGGGLYLNSRDTNVNLKKLDLNNRQIDILTKITNDGMILSYDDYKKLYDKSRAVAERDFSILLYIIIG